MKDEKIYTIQGTSKNLKFHSFVSGLFIAVGIFMIIMGHGDNHTLFWGALIAFVGICYKGINRIRIWWNHE